MTAKDASLTTTGHCPVWDADGNGISVVEYRNRSVDPVHRFGVYVVADDRIEQRKRRNYVAEHRATPAHLVDTLNEAIRWSHGRHAVLTD